MKHDFPIYRPALYNPSLWSREEVKTYFIARRSTLDRIIGDLRRERPNTMPQHRLILGQRGMGKSTLLRRISIEVEDDTVLNAHWLPLTFPEEQYNVASLADFWLNCLDALSDLLEGRGESEIAASIDAQVEKLDRQDADAALKILLNAAKGLKRRLLLLVDNIDLILERLKKEDWALRETLQEHREIMLIGASARALEASYDYGAAFYDFFKIDELRGLTQEEMRETILALAKMRGAEDVIRKVEKDPVRLQVLHTLTGGNPRTAVLLYGVLLKGVDGNVRTDLESLLDEVTPLYKARFEELPTLSQQVLDKLALHWDPMTARLLADALEMDINLTSSQLARLIEIGVVEKVKAGRGKRTAFQVGERFFNIWYLMRASRRVRRKLVWLVEFLRIFYSADELKHIARTRLTAESADSREAEYQLALARALPKEPIGRALETKALEILLAHGMPLNLEEVLDMSGEDRDLVPRAERIKLLHVARKKLQEVLSASGVTFSIEGHIEKTLGLPVPFDVKKKLLENILKVNKPKVNTLNKMDASLTELWNKISNSFGVETAQKLRTACSHGDMIDETDEEGGAAAAERYSCPALALLPKLLRAMDENAPPTDIEILAKKMTQLDAKVIMYWGILGDVLETQNRLNEAEAAYRRVLDINPLDITVWGRLSFFLPLMENRQKDAEIALNKCVELSPEDPAGWVRFATYYHIFHQDDAKAKQLLMKAMETPNKTPKDIASIAATLFRIKEIGRALTYCQELFKMPIEKHSEQEEYGNLLQITKTGLKAGAGPQLLSLFDETEVGQRWRPIREALAAAVEGDAEILNDVAPEVRKPALEILGAIAPQLLPSASNEETKKTNRKSTARKPRLKQAK